MHALLVITKMGLDSLRCRGRSQGNSFALSRPRTLEIIDGAFASTCMLTHEGDAKAKSSTSCIFLFSFFNVIRHALFHARNLPLVEIDVTWPWKLIRARRQAMLRLRHDAITRPGERHGGLLEGRLTGGLCQQRFK